MKRLLIVEDEEILARILKDRFEDAGWRVTSARDGEVAIEMIKTNKFDLVLLDLILPRKDGFEILHEVRTDDSFKKLPIIIVSNLGGDEDIKKALELGATDYFVKTEHSISEIIEKLNKLLIK